MNLNNKTKGLWVISILGTGAYGIHSIQSNSAWTENPYPGDFAIIPEHLVEGIRATKGYCYITLNPDKTQVVSFSPRKIPDIPEPEQPITELERLRADIDYLALLKGVEL
jgi:hypothetical protein